MKLILKYVKPYVIPVLLSLVLLFGQAMSDLSLPNLMSDIVNTGIQLGGIESGSPDAVSENGLKVLMQFMTESQKSAVSSAYTLVNAGNADKSISKKYPETENVNFYQLTEKSDECDNAYSNASYAFMLYMKDVMSENQGDDVSLNSMSSEGLSDVDMDSIYQMLPMLEALPDGALDTYINSAAESDSMIQSQVGTTFTRLFCNELGADLEEIQRSYILNTGLKMLAVALAGVVAAVGVGFISSKLSAAVARKMRHDVFKKVTNFSGAEFDKFSTASLITRTTNDVQQVQMLITMGLRLMCYAPIMGVGGIIMAVNKSPSMSWILGVAVIVLLGLIMIMFAVAMPKFKILQSLIDKLNLVSRENLSGLMVIRAFGNEKREEKRFEEANRELAYTNRFVNRAMSLMMPIMTVIMNFVSLAIIWVGAHKIAESTLQIGDMMAFIQYAMHIIMSFLMIAMMFIMVPRASVSATRIKEVLDCEMTINDTDSKSIKKLGNVKGNVEFKNVSFRYSNAEENVVDNISFTAKSGETTAFIGATGSGKSTLVNLIPRFYDVTDGSITIDGCDIRNISQKNLRDNIGYIPQKGVLFSGDIESNIRYGKEDADINQIMKAIDVAQASEFVQSKDDGISAQVAQGGTNVSGGQKQRLSIARALVKKPPIYIFDDSFSALDFKTDVSLRKALKGYTGESTVFIVAQRVSTIMNAEQIIVLDGGKMVGCGTHRELLKNCPEYREIAESQLSKEELDNE